MPIDHNEDQVKFIEEPDDSRLRSLRKRLAIAAVVEVAGLLIWATRFRYMSRWTSRGLILLVVVCALYAVWCAVRLDREHKEYRKAKEASRD